MDEPLPNPPPELKALLPFVQRANELRSADKVIAYWCCYYAAQLGISGNAKETEAKMYLLTLMDTLEDLKSKLGDNDAVINDTASAAYVENFALKVFVGADNEDRSGKATRATAKKFLAAGQFIELLKIFGTLEPEMQEKIKYAKWKAADIAKAFKEGRKPQPGPEGGDLKLETASVEAAMAPSEVVSKEEEEYLAREMAKLTAGAPEGASDAAEPTSTRDPANGFGMSRGSSSASQKIAPAPTSGNETNPLGSATLDAEEMWKSNSNTAQEISRSLSIQQHSSERPQLQGSSSFNSGIGSGSSPRPLPTPPQRDDFPAPPISAHQHFNGASPSLGQGAGPGAAPASFWGVTDSTSDRVPSAPPDTVLPSVPSDHSALPSVPPQQPPSSMDGHPAIERIDPPRSPTASDLTPAPGVAGTHAPSAPSAPSFVALPPAARVVQPAPMPSAPVVAAPASYPESLDPKLSTCVQKLAKGAASAVDFEDLETARIQLRQALDILEGRTTA